MMDGLFKRAGELVAPIVRPIQDAWELLNERRMPNNLLPDNESVPFQEINSQLFNRWMDLGRKFGKSHMVIWHDPITNTAYPDFQNLIDEQDTLKQFGEQQLVAVYTYDMPYIKSKFSSRFD